MATWGDNGAVRAPSKEYDENYDKIFGNKKEPKSRREVKVLSPEQKKRQAMFPY